MFDARIKSIKKNDMCELCDIIPDKYNKGRIMVNKCFVLHEEVINFFQDF